MIFLRGSLHEALSYASLKKLRFRLGTRRALNAPRTSLWPKCTERISQPQRMKVRLCRVNEPDHSENSIVRGTRQTGDPLYRNLYMPLPRVRRGSYGLYTPPITSSRYTDPTVGVARFGSQVSNLLRRVLYTRIRTRLFLSKMFPEWRWVCSLFQNRRISHSWFAI